MSAKGSNEYNVTGAGTDVPGLGVPWRNMLTVFLICLTLSISISCSSKENTPGSTPKETAKKGTSLPAGAIPLSSVLKAVESANYSPVIEVEFEKDHWEIKAFSGGKLLQLKVDLFTGAILPNPQPSLDKPLSTLVKNLEDQGYGPILDIERSSGASETSAAWEVEGYKGSSEVTITVDSSSGKISPK